MKPSIYGSLIQAYKICPRRSWLMSRNLIGNQQYESFSIWRFVSQTTCKESKIKIKAENNFLEITKSENKNIISIKTYEPIEVIESLVFQILYYIYTLKNYQITGEIIIPRENKTIEVVLTEDKKEELEELIDEMTGVLSNDSPERGSLIQYCRLCPYHEHCLELLSKPMKF